MSRVGVRVTAPGGISGDRCWGNDRRRRPRSAGDRQAPRPRVRRRRVRAL